MIRPAALAAALAALQTCAPVPAVARPCSGASALLEGGAAPCDGILWPSAWTVEALRCRRVELPACQADAARAAALAAAELEGERARASTWRELAEARRRQLEAIVAAPPPPPPPWYASPWAWAAGGFVLGVAATVGAVHLAGQLGR